MDDQKWLSLNQLLGDLSEVNSESEELIRLVSQLVLELASELTCTDSIKTMNLPLQPEEVFLTNRNEELA